MRYLLILSCVLIFAGCKNNPSNSDDQEEQNLKQCIDGLSDGKYACENIDLLSNLPLEELGEDQTIFDLWGWTDPSNGSEYAFLALSSKVIFIDLTEPTDPVLIGELPESQLNVSTPKQTNSDATDRSIKTYADHLFVVSDGQPHGMQVFDLANLRDYSGDYLTFTEDALYEGAYNAHRIRIHEESGFAYLTGVQFGEQCYQGGLHIVDINNPTSPSFSGCYDQESPAGNASYSDEYIYNVNCITYDGPDADYQNQEICFTTKGDLLEVIDVTDKANPTLITHFNHSNYYLVDEIALSPSKRYLFTNDIEDELYMGQEPNTRIWDISDLDTVIYDRTFKYEGQATDLDIQTQGLLWHASVGVSGFYIVDYSNIIFNNIQVKGYFDTEFEKNCCRRDGGAISSYSFSESGNIAIADFNKGFFLVEPQLDNTPE
tara:strand:+ start:51538 stop:52833 length:1296 start_codon:yes stop_codon:yes gene_type:complete